ncbi:MAG: serine protease, partial [Chlorobi bacterium]|nr:serine protease [Chlorobiota bacterium]
MKKILIIIIAITFSLLAKSQKVSPNTYVISFIDKDTATFKIYEPEKFLSERAINRRQKY